MVFVMNLSRCPIDIPVIKKNSIYTMSPISSECDMPKSRRMYKKFSPSDITRQIFVPQAHAWFFPPAFPRAPWLTVSGKAVAHSCPSIPGPWRLVKHTSLAFVQPPRHTPGSLAQLCSSLDRCSKVMAEKHLSPSSHPCERAHRQ